MEVAGKMTAYLEDERSAVQRIRLATGDFGGCTDGFPDQRLVLEIGNRNQEGGNTGGLFESEVWWMESLSPCNTKGAILGVLMCGVWIL